MAFSSEIRPGLTTELTPKTWAGGDAAHTWNIHDAEHGYWFVILEGADLVNVVSQGKHGESWGEYPFTWGKKLVSVGGEFRRNPVTGDWLYFETSDEHARQVTRMRAPFGEPELTQRQGEACAAWFVEAMRAFIASRRTELAGAEVDRLRKQETDAEQAARVAYSAYVHATQATTRARDQRRRAERHLQAILNGRA